MATVRIKTAAVLIAVCVSFALGGCGTENVDSVASDSTSESPNETPASTETPTETTSDPGALPECADVWVDGQILPVDYIACTSDGQAIRPSARKCGYGATFLEQDGQFYAMKGQPITDAGDLETSDEYQQLLATCQA